MGPPGDNRAGRRESKSVSLPIPRQNGRWKSSFPVSHLLFRLNGTEQNFPTGSPLSLNTHSAKLR